MKLFNWQVGTVNFWCVLVSCPTRWSLYWYLGFCNDQHPDNRETGYSNVLDVCWTLDRSAAYICLQRREHHSGRHTSARGWICYHNAVSCQWYSFTSSACFAKWICAIPQSVHCIGKAREWWLVGQLLIKRRSSCWNSHQVNMSRAPSSGRIGVQWKRFESELPVWGWWV